MGTRGNGATLGVTLNFLAVEIIVEKSIERASSRIWEIKRERET